MMGGNSGNVPMSSSGYSETDQSPYRQDSHNFGYGNNNDEQPGKFDFWKQAKIQKTFSFFCVNRKN